MPTDHPRINVVVEVPLYETIKNLAEKDEISLSKKCRDLLIDSLERNEDVRLEKVVESRNNDREFLSHEVLKSRLDLN